MGTLGYVRAVLWSFFGIRRRVAAADELDKAEPLLCLPSPSPSPSRWLPCSD